MAGPFRSTPWLLALLLLAPGAGVRGQSSPDVPPLDPAYGDLAVLLSRGWSLGLLAGQGPHSRMAFARAVAHARAAAAGGTSPVAPRVTEALRRLEATFADELALLCSPPGGAAPPPEACPTPERKLTLRRTSVSAHAMDAPPRAIPTRYLSRDSIGGEKLDADVSPFLEDAQGRWVDPEGWTLGGEAAVEGTLGRRLSGSVHPRIAVSDPTGAGTRFQGTLQEGYVRASVANLAITVGRAYAPIGYARSYGPLISQNARALDQIRISVDELSRLPWIFSALGPARGALWVADLGSDRDIPGSKLIGMQGTIRPHPNLELGATLLNQQFGEGAPPASWGERIRDFFFMASRRFLPFEDPGEFSDKVLAANARLAVPGVGAHVYVDFMTTDDHNLFRSPADGFGNNAAWTVGAARTAFGPEGRLDAWVEGTTAGVRAYTHHQFTSGMTLDRRVLGSPLGPLGSGLRGGVAWETPSDRVEVEGALERYDGDLYQETGARRTWERIEEHPAEVRLRGTLTWARRPLPLGVLTTFRLGYEDVRRFGFTEASRKNLLGQVTVSYTW